MMHRPHYPLGRRIARSLAVAVSLASSIAHAVAVGEAAPDLSATSSDGKPARLADLRGKTVWLDFWASWCGPCRQSFPWMNAMQEKYGASGLAIVAVNVDKKRADADKFLAQVPARFPLAFDPEGATPNAYAIKAMPTSVLIDRDGRVVAVHNGFRGEDREALEAKIASSVGRAPASK
jgi:thiol-disulfide isomerase/thioredoxin